MFTSGKEVVLPQFVCIDLSMSAITQTTVDEFSWNLGEETTKGQKAVDWILTLICSTRIRIQQLFFKTTFTRFALRKVRPYGAVLFIIWRIIRAVALRHEPVDDCKCSYYSFGLFSKHGSCHALHRVPNVFGEAHLHLESAQCDDRWK